MTLAEVEARLRGMADGLHAQADELLGTHAAVVHDAAGVIQKLTSSRIVSEVMQYGEEHLPASTVDAIVTVIRDAGEAASRISQLTAPPPPLADQAPSEVPPQ